jgi:N-acetylneuraminate synthase
MVKIIAEAGTNHNGNINLAYKLVDVAKNSGADFVKFQIINPESLYVPFYWENKKKIKSIVFERRKEESLTNDEWQKNL